MMPLFVFLHTSCYIMVGYLLRLPLGRILAWFFPWFDEEDNRYSFGQLFMALFLLGTFTEIAGPPEVIRAFGLHSGGSYWMRFLANMFELIVVSMPFCFVDEVMIIRIFDECIYKLFNWPDIHTYGNRVFEYKDLIEGHYEFLEFANNWIRLEKEAIRCNAPLIDADYDTGFIIEGKFAGPPKKWYEK